MQFRFFKLISIGFLTLIFTITYPQPSISQIPFLELFSSPEQPSSSVFDPLNKPETCENLKCSLIWLDGAPLFKIASPPLDTPEKNATGLPVNIRARRIQNKLQLMLNLTWKFNRLKKVDKTQPLVQKNLKDGLYAYTPIVEVKIENKEPLIYIPSQPGLLKQTIMNVTEWDIVPNQQILAEIDENNGKFRQEIATKNKLADDRQIESFILAKHWQQIIREKMSQALTERAQDLRYSLVKPLTMIGLVILTLFIVSLLGFLKHRLHQKERELKRQITEVNRSLAAVAESSQLNQSSRSSTTMNEPMSILTAESTISKDLANITNNLQSLIENLGKFSINQQTILKQQRNLLLLIIRILLLAQFVIWGSLIGISLAIYPQTRAYGYLLMLRFSQIIIIWLIFSTLDKVSDFLIDFSMNKWASESQLTNPSPRYQLRANTYANALKQTTTFILTTSAIVSTLLTIGFSAAGLVSAGAFTLLVTYILNPNIKNVINGCLILAMDQYAVGDIICVAGRTGLVENMNLYMTQLRGPEGRLITLPNGEINIVENLTKDWSRFDFKILISYEANVQAALEVLRQVGEEMRNDPAWQEMILEPANILGIEELSHQGILIQAWLKTQPLKQWAVGREFRWRVKQAFDQAQIAIGIPKQELAVIPSAKNDENAQFNQAQEGVNEIKETANIAQNESSATTETKIN